MFRKIDDIVIKSIISIEPIIVNKSNSSKHGRTSSFEVYGFDILIDQNFKPWLLEVNISPSFSSSAPIDKKIKSTLMADVLNLVGFIAFDKNSVE